MFQPPSEFFALYLTPTEQEMLTFVATTYSASKQQLLRAYILASYMALLEEQKLALRNEEKKVTKKIKPASRTKADVIDVLILTAEKAEEKESTQKEVLQPAA